VVLVERATGFSRGRKGWAVRPGDRVVTRPGARAVLTFFDGSTVTLEEDTIVLIRSLVDANGQLRTVLAQSRGSTWTHIPQALGPAQIEIDTPNARVETNEASFATTVQDSGRTQVGSQSGALAVTSGGQRTEVTGGFQAAVEAPGVVGPTNPSARPQRELIVRVSGPVYAFLTDPEGATIGTLDPGVPVNQVPGATATRQGDQLVLRLPDPDNGRYRLGLRAAGAGNVGLIVEVHNGTTSNGSRSFRVAEGENWSVDLSLDRDDIEVVSVERKDQDVRPALVTVPERAAEKAKASQPLPVETKQTQPDPTSTPVRPTVQPSVTPRPQATPAIGPVQPVQPQLYDSNTLDQAR
jgi:hypothetical protein